MQCCRSRRKEALSREEAGGGVLVPHQLLEAPLEQNQACGVEYCRRAPGSASWGGLNRGYKERIKSSLIAPVPGSGWEGRSAQGGHTHHWGARRSSQPNPSFSPSVGARHLRQAAAKPRGRQAGTRALPPASLPAHPGSGRR